MSCGNVPQIENSNLVTFYDRNYTNEMVYGSYIEVECKNGYEMNGNSKLNFTDLIVVLINQPSYSVVSFINRINNF